MAWEAAPTRLPVLVIAMALLSTTLPVAGQVDTLLEPAPMASSAEHASDPSSAIAWDGVEFAPASASGLGIGVSETTALLSTDEHGTFVSTDGARTWTLADASVTAGSVEFDPDDPDTGYVAGFGGVLRTIDGGQTFELVLEAHRARAIDTSPSGAVAIGVAGEDRKLDVLVSHDQGDTWEPTGWPSDRYTVKAVEFGLDDDNLVVAAGDQTWVTLDGGDTWSLDDELGAETMAAEADGTLWAADTRETRTSTDGGQTWTVHDAPGIPKAMEERDDEGIFAATDRGVFTTQDGTAWTNMTYEPISKAARELATDPSDPDAVFIADGRVGVGQISPVETSDGFSYEGRTTGLPTVPILALDVAADGSTLMAGTPQGIHATTPGSGEFPHAGGGILADDILTVAAAPGGEIMYAGGDTNNHFATLFVTQDGGETWDDLQPTGTGSKVLIMQAHPGDPETAWAGIGISEGSDRVYETQDAGETWVPIYETVGVDVTGVSQSSAKLSDLAYDEQDDRLLIATDRGLIGYDPATTSVEPIHPGEVNAVATTQDHVYVDGDQRSVWSNAGDPTGTGSLLTPWADTGEDVDELAASTTDTEHVLTRSSSGALHHCLPAGETEGTCQAAALPAGSPTSVATSSGEAWAGTLHDGLYRASLG